MRIAEIVTIRKPHGPAFVAADVVREMKGRSDVEGIDVYYFDDSDLNVFPSDVPCYKLNFRKPIDFKQYAVIHTHMIRSDWYMRYHYRKWSKCGCKWVSTIHQQTWKDLVFRFGVTKAVVIKFIWDFCLRKASAVVAVGRSIQDEYKFVNARLIYNGVKFVAVEPIEKHDEWLLQLKKSGRRVIGGVANVIRRKGFEQVIKALPDLPDWDFVLVGGGAESGNLEQLSKDLGVSERVHLLGAREKGFRYMSFFDVFALTSRSEGCCLSGLEANRSGLPLVASRIAPFEEIYSKDDVAYFDLDDVGSLVAAIKIAYDNRNILSARSRSLFESKFNTPRMAEEYFGLFKSLEISK